MKHLIKLVILIGLLVNIDKSYGANQPLVEDAAHCLSMLTVDLQLANIVMLQLC